MAVRYVPRIGFHPSSPPLECSSRLKWKALLEGVVGVGAEVDIGMEPPDAPSLDL